MYVEWADFVAGDDGVLRMKYMIYMCSVGCRNASPVREEEVIQVLLSQDTPLGSNEG